MNDRRVNLDKYDIRSVENMMIVHNLCKKYHGVVHIVLGSPVGDPYFEILDFMHPDPLKTSIKYDNVHDVINYLTINIKKQRKPEFMIGNTVWFMDNNKIFSAIVIAVKEFPSGNEYVVDDRYNRTGKDTYCENELYASKNELIDSVIEQLEMEKEKQ